MNCVNCRDALAHTPTKERVSKVQALDLPECACEQCCADGSSSTVGDEEIIHIIVSDPTDISANGSLMPHVGVQFDRGGWSALRDAAENSEFEQTMKEFRERKGEGVYFHGVFSFQAKEVRYEGERRLACIYDTPLPGKPNHVDLMAPTAASGSERKKRLKRILDRIEPQLVTALLFRGGCLSEYTNNGGIQE